MHPDKFLGRTKIISAPEMSDGERDEKLEALGQLIAGKREEAITARKQSGIEEIWLACEEAYLGIDDENRHEFANAKWAKPTSISGPLVSEKSNKTEMRSNAFVRLTTRYVDGASAKLAEILLPVDDKAFSATASPVPELIKQLGNHSPIAHPTTGQPVIAQPNPNTAAPQPGQPPVQPAAPAPLTPAMLAQKKIDEANEAAELAENRIYDWMVEGKYAAEARKVIKDAARIGCGVLKGPFPEIRASRAARSTKNGIAMEIVQEIKPTQRWVDPWNLFPADGCGENVRDGDYVFERDFLSSRKLNKLADQPGYLDRQIARVIKEGPDKVNIKSSSPNERKSKNRFEIWYYTGVLSREDMSIALAIGIEDIPEDQEDVHAIVTMVNDTVIRATINPMDSGNFAYNVMSWSRRPGHWAGVGVAEQMSMPQRMVNASTRALLNNAGISAGPQIILDQLGVVPANGQWTLTPNKIWWKTGESTAQDVRQAFFAVIIPSVQKEMMGIIEYAMKLAEESTGIPLITQGQTGPTTPQTFGAAELQDNNAHTWLRSIAYAYDDMITEPLVMDYYEWLLLDPNVPDAEKGDFKINAHGSISMVERAIQEQTLLQMLQASANPAFKVDPGKLFAEYLKAKRLDPRKIQFSQEDQDKLAQQPPPPPIQVMVEQAKGQNAMQLKQLDGQQALQEITAKVQAEAQAELASMQQNEAGQMSPHMANASARIEQERIKAQSSAELEEKRSQTQMLVEQSRANAEAARAQKEFDIAQQNGQMDIQKLQIQREMAILEYANRERISINQVKAAMAKAAMDNQTKRELSSAEIQLAHDQSMLDRQHDLHKHNTSLQRDMMSTPNTP